mmetsp:Transcript_1308/g.2166  ORF Transcript_1308/g.2166 Transcript_1308/m.2166 type:complete len:114 (-) Transcript_1308:77-418(-)
MRNLPGWLPGRRSRSSTGVQSLVSQDVHRSMASPVKCVSNVQAGHIQSSSCTLECIWILECMRHEGGIVYIYFVLQTNARSCAGPGGLVAKGGMEGPRNFVLESNATHKFIWQ